MASFINGDYVKKVVKEVVAGSNVTIDNTDPERPVVSASGDGSTGPTDFVRKSTGGEFDGRLGVEEKLFVYVPGNTGLQLAEMNVFNGGGVLQLKNSSNLSMIRLNAEGVNTLTNQTIIGSNVINLVSNGEALGVQGRARATASWEVGQIRLEATGVRAHQGNLLLSSVGGSVFLRPGNSGVEKNALEATPDGLVRILSPASGSTSKFLGVRTDGTVTSLNPSQLITAGDNLTWVGNRLNAVTSPGDAYILPTASSTIKGGVRIGAGLNMTGEVLSANGYTLPTASSTVLGGIKVGARLSISNGVLSADVQSGGGGTGVYEKRYTSNNADPFNISTTYGKDLDGTWTLLQVLDLPNPGSSTKTGLLEYGFRFRLANAGATGPIVELYGFISNQTFPTTVSESNQLDGLYWDAMAGDARFMQRSGLFYPVEISNGHAMGIYARRSSGASTPRLRMTDAFFIFTELQDVTSSPQATLNYGFGTSQINNI